LNQTKHIHTHTHKHHHCTHIHTLAQANKYIENSFAKSAFNSSHTHSYNISEPLN